MSDSNSLLLNAHEALMKAGVEVDRIYRRIGVDPAVLLQPGVRIPHQAQGPFWAAVEAVTGDPEIGLHLCPYISPLAGEIMNSLLVTSLDVRSGIELFLRHLLLVSDHIVLQMRDDPGSDCVRIGGQWGEDIPRHTEITLTYITMKMLRIASSGKFQPLRLGFRCPPGDRSGEFAAVFGCEVVFDQDESFAEFHRSMLALPLIHADPDLHKMQQVVAQRRLRAVSLRRVAEDVRQAVAGMLDGGPPSLAQVAGQLGRSERTLRAELQDAGTNFNQLVAESQKALAKRLLAGTSLSAEEVGYRVGFAERSAFYRAFKRWTGTTPSQYRLQRQSGGDAAPPDGSLQGSRGPET